MIRNARVSVPSSVILALVTLLSLVFPAALAEDDSRLRVAVIDFDTEALQASWHFSWHWSNLSRSAAANLAEELFKTGRFRVIERQRLDAVLGEQNLGDSGRIDPTTAARIGKILGVQLVVIGSISEFGIKEQGARIPQIGKWKWGRGIGGKLVTGKCALSARLVDTTTAEILAIGEAESSYKFGKGEFAGANLGTTWDSGMASKVLSKAVEKLARDIAAGAANVDPSTFRGGLVGKIAKVSGDKIFVNLGSSSAVKVGDRFTVTALGEAIIDPDTGENLGGIESEIGEIEITQVVGAKLSVARPIAGSGFAVGNKITMK